MTLYLQIYIYYLLSVPPSIDIVGINTNPKVKQGQPHTLICPARGTPPPDITWYKDGQPIDYESEPDLTLKANGRHLYFQEVNVKDDGKYKCVASNEAGESEQDFDLDILGKAILTPLCIALELAQEKEDLLSLLVNFFDLVD